MGAYTNITRVLDVLFGDPRIEDCMRLPGAFRSLPRPSSASEPSHPSDSERVSGPTDYSPVGRRYNSTRSCATWVLTYGWSGFCGCVCMAVIMMDYFSRREVDHCALESTLFRRGSASRGVRIVHIHKSVRLGK